MLLCPGDNAENSYDSRYWEEPFVKEEDVVARVIS
ncbi:S26 family signal peptidase [Enterocloster bolteae]